MLGVSLDAFASTITMKTTKAVGETISLAFNADMQVALTWGDGSTEEFLSYGKLKDFTVKSESLTITTDKDITALYACENDLTELDVSGAASLERLYCSSNALTKLDLSKCINLTQLDCQDNQLVGITIGSLNMKYVNVAGNQLSSSGLKSNGVANIVSLVCAGNKMSTISYLSSMTSLRTLICQDNQLPSLSISKCKTLRYLVASNNKLAALNVPALIELQKLYVDNNQLETLDFSSNPVISKISAEGNKLKELTWNQTSGAYPLIEYVNFANNSLFFNSFPTIYNYVSHKYTLAANLTPQNPYHLIDAVNINETYNYRDKFVTNGWGSGVNATITMTNDKGEVLEANTDYTYRMGQFTFLKPYTGVVINATSRYYPDIMLAIEPFNIIDPTGIADIEIEKSNTDAPVYDLQGRKVQTPQSQKGIYIVNGKKFVIR